MRRFCAAAVVFAGAVSSGSFARADDPVVGPPAPSEPTAIVEVRRASDERRTVGRLPANLAHAALGVWSKPNLAPLLIGSGLTGLASTLDQKTAHAHEPPAGALEEFSEVGGTMGGSLAVGIATAGLFTAGRFARDARFRAFSYDILEGTLLNAAYTQVLKTAVGRTRPDGSDSKSFPSGHTSNAFAWATIVEHHYGWKAGVPAYAMAAAIGAARVTGGKHYLSDVAAGATLGVIVGRTVGRLNGRVLGASSRIAMAPIVGAHHTYGMAVSVNLD